MGRQRWFLVLVSLGFILTTAASGQWIVDSLQLPDTLGRKSYHAQVVYAENENKLFVEGDSRLVVVDGETHRKTNAVALPSDSVGRILYVASAGKLYCALGSRVAVVDAASENLLTLIPVGSMLSWPVAYNPVNDRIYWEDPGREQLVVIDVAGDSVVGSVAIGGTLWDICLNPVENKLYCGGLNSGYVTVVDCSGDTVLKVMDLPWATGLAHMPLANKVYCVQWRRDSLQVIDCELDSVVRRTPLRPDREYRYLRSSPEHQKAYAVSGGLVEVIDARTDSVVDTLRLDDNILHLSSIYFSETMGDLYIGADDLHDGSVYVIDGAGDSLVAVHRVYEPSEIGGDTRHGRVGVNGAWHVVAFDAWSRKPVADIAFGWDNAGIALSRDGSELYIANFWGSGIGVYDANTLELLAVPAVGREPVDVCIDTVRNQVYVANSDTTLAVIDTDTDSVVAWLAVEKGLVTEHQRRLACNPVTGKVYCWSIDDRRITAIDGNTNTVVGSIPLHVWEEADLVWNYRDNKAYAQQRLGVAVIDGGSDSVVCLVPAFGNGALVFDEGGGRLFVPGDDSLYVVDGAGDTLLAKVYVARDGVRGVGCCTRGDKVYCGGRDSVYALDGSGYEVIAAIPFPRAEVFHYNPVSNRMYCGYTGRQTAVIDCATDSIVARLDLGGIWKSDIVTDPLANRTYIAPRGEEMLWVIGDSAPGVAEEKAEGGGLRVEAKLPTVVRGVLRLPGDMTDFGSVKSDRVPRYALLDIAGRKVMTLVPGENDVRGWRRGCIS